MSVPISSISSDCSAIELSGTDGTTCPVYIGTTTVRSIVIGVLDHVADPYEWLRRFVFGGDCVRTGASAASSFAIKFLVCIGNGMHTWSTPESRFRNSFRAFALMHVPPQSSVRRPWQGHSDVGAIGASFSRVCFHLATESSLENRKIPVDEKKDRDFHLRKKDTYKRYAGSGRRLAEIKLIAKRRARKCYR